MRKILHTLKRKAVSFLKRVLGIRALEQRVTQLENVHIGVQIENGLRYLDKIRCQAGIKDTLEPK